MDGTHSAISTPSDARSQLLTANRGRETQRDVEGLADGNAILSWAGEMNLSSNKADMLKQDDSEDSERDSRKHFSGVIQQLHEETNRENDDLEQRLIL